MNSDRDRDQARDRGGKERKVGCGCVPGGLAVLDLSYVFPEVQNGVRIWKWCLEE